MGQIEKFMFDVSFDEAELARVEAEAKAAEEAEAEQERFEEEVPSFTEEELDAARREGFDAGRDEGVREAAEAIETRISDALNVVSENFTALFHQQTATNAALFDDAINIAVAISRKCFPHLNETQAPRVIEDMLRQVLAEIIEEPRALVHVHPELVETLNARVADVAETANFEGQVLVIDDEKIPPGDCRITWSSGSAERDMSIIWRQVDEIVEQNLNAVTQEIVEGEAVGEAESAGEIAAPDAPTQEPAAGPGAPDAAAADDGGARGDGATGQEPPPGDAAAETPPDDEEDMEINRLEDDAAERAVAPAAAMEPDTDTLEAAAEMAEEDPTEVHLQAGPGIVEEPGDEAILETEPETEQSDDQPTDEVDEEATQSMPPPGPNP